jgi:hypothetical protein
MSENDIQTLIASNAKAIQALSEALAADREERQKTHEEWEKDRHKLYQYLGRIASAQSSFYEVQADYYQQLALISERQTKIEEQQVQMQGQIIDILKKLSNSSDS